MQHENQQEEPQQENLPVQQDETGLVPRLGAPDAVDVLKTRLAQWNQIRYALIGQTKASDWLKFGDSFYLADSGASELIVPTGFRLTDTRIEGPKLLEDEKGKFWYIRASAVAQFQNAIVEVTRSLSSRDPFFTGRDEHIPYTDIRPENVEGKCLTQLRRKAVCTIFALNGLDEIELGKAGVNVKQIQAVEFRSGRRGGRAQTESAQSKVRRLMEWVQGQDESLFKPLYRLLSGAKEGESATPPEQLDTVSAVQILERLESIQAAIANGELKGSEAVLEFAQKLVGA